jgi:hypothetical protein
MLGRQDFAQRARVFPRVKHARADRSRVGRVGNQEGHDITLFAARRLAFVLLVVLGAVAEMSTSGSQPGAMPPGRSSNRLVFTPMMRAVFSARSR